MPCALHTNSGSADMRSVYGVEEHCPHSCFDFSMFEYQVDVLSKATTRSRSMLASVRMPPLLYFPIEMMGVQVPSMGAVLAKTLGSRTNLTLVLSSITYRSAAGSLLLFLEATLQ